MFIYYKTSNKTNIFFVKKIFSMDAELLHDIVFMCLLLIVVMLGAVAALQYKVYKYKHKIYFIRRDRERCNELLYAAKDGYYCFVYPDQKVKDPQKGIMEKCSRRLAVLLNLKDGTAASFAEVLESFNKDDAKVLKKYISFLQQEGRSFEDMLYLKGGRSICVYGNRINGADNNLYCDIVWFRDVTPETSKIGELLQEKKDVEDSLNRLEQIIDGIDYPVWLRDENLKMLVVNKKYLEFTSDANKSEVLKKQIEICNNKGEAIALTLAAAAQKSKKMQKRKLNIVRGGELFNFELRESPYYVGDALDKIGTVGYLVDNTALEKAKRNFKINQNNHLEVLGALGTAFAIFDDRSKLYFYNVSFKRLWNLDNEFLEKTPSYLQFLETVRENKMLPPVPDIKNFKQEEMSVFGGFIETKEDLLHLPDGRTIRRLRTPHPNGVIFAFEDVSDRLATMRRLNDLTSMQQSILDNLSDSVLIFGPHQRLKFYNRSYLKLWGLDFERLQDEPKLDEVISLQKLFFSNVDDWAAFKNSIMDNIMSGRRFNLLRDDNTDLAVSPLIFYDGSLMITYTVK